MDQYDGSEIAIVGMAGRFPGARDTAELWRNLRDGVDGVRRLSDAELERLGVPAARRSDPRYVPVTAQMPEVDGFDAPFFGVGDDEAALLDPQQRIWLELAWEALESAGYDPEAGQRSIGVFAGASLSTYLLFNLAGGLSPGASTDPRELEALTGNSGDSLATRISYKLNLKGPSFTVQSACSTSLVAVHLAAASLLSGECDLALAGAVTVKVNLLAGYLCHPGGILSPGGRCRAFDAGADGMLFGHGGGVVVLKRLADAMADRDAVRAVIRGSAVNNDGKLKAGYSAPAVEGQAEVLTEAWSAAGIDPATLSYIEAHGTGTPMGDSIEVKALTRAMQPHTARRGFCALGAVKTGIGHLDVASGVAGLIKTVLALEHRQIPPSLHLEQSSPEIDFAASPLRLATRLEDWPAAAGAPRRAGVSSFGLGGTNAHLVVEEAPAAPLAPSRGWDLLVLSARSAAALERATDALAGHLDAGPGAGGLGAGDLASTDVGTRRLGDDGRGASHLDASSLGASHPRANHRTAADAAPELSDVAFTLQTGRRRFEHRRALLCRPGEDAAGLLRRRDPGRVVTLAEEAADLAVVTLLPGEADLFPGAGAGLYSAEPLFRREVDRCAGLLATRLGRDVVRSHPVFQAPPGSEALSTIQPLPAATLAATAIQAGHAGSGQEPGASDSQAAAFTLQYALARLFASWGIRATSAIGLGAGRLAAACLSGALTLEAALARLVDPHGEQQLAAGSGPPAPSADDEALRQAAAAWRLPAGAVLELGTGTLGRRAAAHSEPPAHAASRLIAALEPPADADPGSAASPVAALARLWLLGARPDWAAFHAGEVRRRVPLPTYPFEHRRYWQDAPGVPRPLSFLASPSPTEAKSGDENPVPLVAI